MAEQEGLTHHAVLEGIKKRMRSFRNHSAFFDSQEDRLVKQRTLKIHHDYFSQDLVDRPSAQHCINHIHIHAHSHPVTKLHLSMVPFSDGALGGSLGETAHTQDISRLLLSGPSRPSKCTTLHQSYPYSCTLSSSNNASSINGTFFRWSLGRFVRPFCE
jgi:hypothetical protein